MPVPTLITDLSTTASSNSPAGSDVIAATMDDYIRSHAAFIAQNYANKASLAQLAASSGSSLVGFLQSGTGAVTRTEQDKLRDIVSVKDFGAVGDGVTDDTAAIQATINSGALDVLIPQGNYLCGPLIMPSTPYFVLRGNGTGSRLIQKATTGALIGWSQSAMVYSEQTIKDLYIKGTNGLGHCIDTTGAGGPTIQNIFISDLPVGFSGIYVNGAAATYAHDVRIRGLQVYSNTAGHSNVRFGGLCSDTSLTDFIANGNFSVQYGLYYDAGATTIRVVDAHPYNNATNVLKMAGSNDFCSFNSVVMDNATNDIGSATNSAYVTFTDCWFEAIKSGKNGLSVVNCSGWSMVNCKFTGSVGAAAAFAEDATSNYNRVIGGNLGVIGNFTAPFVFFGAQSYSRNVNGINSLGLAYSYSSVTQVAQAQNTVQYVGVNGGQASLGNTAYVVPQLGYITTITVAVDSTPAAGQTFTMQAYNGATPIGSALVISNGQFGGTITLNLAVNKFDQVGLKSTFSATSGIANVRYVANFTA